MKLKQLFFFGPILALMACSSNDPEVSPYQPTPYTLEIPQLFEDYLIPPVIPENNPLTVEGIALGKRLFFDPILSGNRQLACANCHMPEHGFSDRRAVSLGIAGVPGTRNSMPLFNLAWNYNSRFAWDGKEIHLEGQAFEPVTNPIEMHADWNQIADRLQNHPEYPSLFEAAFGDHPIDSVVVVKVIAQFERTLISADSKFDRYLRGNATLSPNEQNGLAVFMDEERGDCFHCHGNPNNPLWTDNDFHNNALDQEFSDLGLGRVTGDPNDNGKFRTPSLRNLSFTAPYMHDGRFRTLREVIDHYSEGLQYSATVDPLMKNVAQGGVHLSPADKQDLIAFLRTLDDLNFIQNPAHRPDQQDQ
ncbi:MAG: cytochrome-c peroxidase [Flavobacteriaceae bacterium]